MSAQLSLFKGRQRGLKLPTAKEFALHCLIADTLRRWQTTGWRWSHFPAGEKRNIITASRLKRMGVARGWPDFLLLAPYPATLHCLELKREGGKLTDEQQSFCDWCTVNGYPYAMADNFKDAVTVLRDWGAIRATVEV